MDRKTLKRLAEIRLDEAQTLLAAKKYSGAYYLAGYSVECGMKACVAKNIRAEVVPEPKFDTKFYSQQPIETWTVRWADRHRPIRLEPNLFR